MTINTQYNIFVDYKGKFYTINKLKTFLKNCTDEYITISVSGNSYIYQYKNNLVDLIQKIKKYTKFKINLKTNEYCILELIPSVDSLEITLNNDIIKDFETINAKHQNVIYSVMLPPVKDPDIVDLHRYYLNLQNFLKRPLILLENNKSIFKIDRDKLLFMNIDFVSVEDIMGNYYLHGNEFCGYDLYCNVHDLWNKINADNRLFIFGGALKHYLFPVIHELRDIDIVINDVGIINELFLEDFDIRINNDICGRNMYFILTNKKNPEIMLHIIVTKDPEKFILSSQYDVDQIYLRGSELFSANNELIISNIQEKKATLLNKLSDRDLSMFHCKRLLIECQYKNKLLKKGWLVNEG